MTQTPSTATEPTDTSPAPATGVWPTLVYRDPPAAIRFLTEALGFEQASVSPGPTEGSIVHAELRWPTAGGVMISSTEDGRNDFNVVADGVTSVYLVTDEPDRLFERATAAGAEVVLPLRDEDYGSRGFSIRDTEDNLWSVGTYRGAN